MVKLTQLTFHSATFTYILYSVFDISLVCYRLRGKLNILCLGYTNGFLNKMIIYVQNIINYLGPKSLLSSVKESSVEITYIDTEHDKLRYCVTLELDPFNDSSLIKPIIA